VVTGVSNLKSDCIGMMPVLTTQAGACMTAASWQEAGIHSASFYLAALLMKPGYDFLMTLPDLATYVGWQEGLVLNASLPAMNTNGLYALRSHYDGHRSYYSVDDILTLVSRLKPSVVIFPEGVWHKNDMLWQSLPETIVPFFPVTDLPTSLVAKKAFGVYISCDTKTSPSEALEQLAIHNDKPCYIAGDLSLSLMVDLVHNGAKFVESDRPASDACHGKVYWSEGELSLSDPVFSMQFEPIDPTCSCSTCSQKLTRAYLHHLLEHTPLLCQRLLVQHNVHYCQARLSAYFLSLKNEIA
jgi:queuine tRNA-ribosyltransferase